MSERNVGGFFQKDADAIFKPMGVSDPLVRKDLADAIDLPSRYVPANPALALVETGRF